MNHQRHRFHSICPYFAMFPEEFARVHVSAWTEPGDVVFDPFSGRGTTVFEALLRGRAAFGTDTSEVAVCVSSAKADPPRLVSIKKRLDVLEETLSRKAAPRVLRPDDFFANCFSKNTFRQLSFLRGELAWRRSRTDRFIAALCLGSLHGESHRSERYFSNRMPRTISTKPAYSIRWWNENGYTAPERDAFAVLRSEAEYRFESEPAAVRGRVSLSDARVASRSFPGLKRSVKLVVTSPPYLDTTNFREDQWLRRWFLGGPPHPPRGPRGDDRHHSAERYWAFLGEAWSGVAPLLKADAVIVVRVGGKKFTASQIEHGVVESLRSGLQRPVEVVEARSSAIVKSQIRSFSNDEPTSASREVDVVVRLTGRQRPARRLASRS